jgi:hypothetical protein
MLTHVFSRSYSLMQRLSSLEGHWAGEVHSADGTLLGQERISCAWEVGHRAFRVTSWLVSRAGRVLGAEQATLVYDAGTDSVTALLREGSGRTDLARAYPNAGNALVLVSDGDLRLRRFSWPAGGDPAGPAPDTWRHRLEVATGDRLHPEWQAVLHRVEPA